MKGPSFPKHKPCRPGPYSSIFTVHTVLLARARSSPLGELTLCPLALPVPCPRVWMSVSPYRSLGCLPNSCYSDHGDLREMPSLLPQANPTLPRSLCHSSSAAWCFIPCLSRTAMQVEWFRAQTPCVALGR